MLQKFKFYFAFIMWAEASNNISKVFLQNTLLCKKKFCKPSCTNLVIVQLLVFSEKLNLIFLKRSL